MHPPLNYERLTEAIMAEVDRVLAMSWNRFGRPEYCVNRLCLLAHLLIEAGDYDTPVKIVDDWKARYLHYAERGGKGHFRDLLIPITEEARARARSLRRPDEGGILLDPMSRVCPVCRVGVGQPCRNIEAGEFHDLRYDAPDAQDPMTGLTDPLALR